MVLYDSDAKESCMYVILMHSFHFCFKCGWQFHIHPWFKTSWHPAKSKNLYFIIISLSQHILTLRMTYQFILLTISLHLQVQHCLGQPGFIYDTLINFLDIIHFSNFCLKWHCGGWTLSPSSSKKPTLLGSINRATLYLQTGDRD